MTHWDELIILTSAFVWLYTNITSRDDETASMVECGCHDIQRNTLDDHNFVLLILGNIEFLKPYWNDTSYMSLIKLLFIDFYVKKILIIIIITSKQVRDEIIITCWYKCLKYINTPTSSQDAWKSLSTLYIHLYNMYINY